MPLKALNSSKKASIPTGIVFDPKNVSQILEAVRPPKIQLPPEESRIMVHAAVSRISVLYEKLRNAVEYREEHLLRKGGISRILRRQLVLERDPQLISSRLITELIAARYLPNETLPETLIDDVALIISKYQAIAAEKAGNERHMRWVFGVIISEIEETLVVPYTEKALVSFLYQRLSEKIVLHSMRMEDSDRRLQIYVACYQTLVKADEEQVAYKYLRAYMQEWMRPAEWVDDARVVADKLIGVQQRIDGIMKSRMTQRFLRAVRPWAVSLWMFREALEKEKNPSELLSSVEDTHSAVLSVTAKREGSARGKLFRGTIRAMVYLLITKVAFALILEVPLEKIIYGEYSKMALAINISLPPVVMLFVGLFIRAPGASNRKRIVEHIDILLSSAGPAIQELRVARERRGMNAFMASLFYLVMFVVSFGLIGSGLTKIGFTAVAIFVFFFFLCLVSFFGYRLRATSREIVVVKPKESLLRSVGDFLSLPILRVGRWLSLSISRINVFAFVLDVIFEAPLKIFLGALEDSLRFIREKKDELSE